jgi:hypothetical protein
MLPQNFTIQKSGNKMIYRNAQPQMATKHPETAE